MPVISSVDPMVLVLAGVVFVVGTVLASCASSPRSLLALIVGVTGGLQTAQIGDVHVFCFAVVLWVAFGVLRERRAPVSPWSGVLVIACTAVLASTAIAGQLVNSVLLAVQLLLLASMAAIIAVLGDQEDVRQMLRGLLLTTTTAATMGVLQYLRVLPHELFLGDDRPIGLYSEPDWLGTFCAIGLVLAFYRKPGWSRTALTVMHLASLLLAAARAAWLAAIVVLVIGYLATRFIPAERRPSSSWRLVLVAVVAGAVLMVVNPTLRDFLVERINGAVGDETDVSAEARQKQAIGLFRLAEQSPWNGLGLSASGRVGDSGRISYVGTADNNVASNWIVGWWVDGGLLAVPLIALFIAVAFRRPAVPTGLVLTVVLVSSLFSNAMLIPIAWLSLGVCLVPVDRSRDSSTAALTPAEMKPRNGPAPAAVRSGPPGLQPTGSRSSNSSIPTRMERHGGSA